MANMTPNVEITPSKVPSSNGSRSASASRNSIGGLTCAERSLAADNSSGEMSTAVTSAPRRATLRADQPVPVATSECIRLHAHLVSGRHGMRERIGDSKTYLVIILTTPTPHG